MTQPAADPSPILATPEALIGMPVVAETPHHLEVIDTSTSIDTETMPLPEMDSEYVDRLLEDLSNIISEAKTDPTISEGERGVIIREARERSRTAVLQFKGYTQWSTTSATI